MRVILGVPNADLAEDARSLWRELKTIASPFPFECSDDDLQVLWEQTGCDIEVPSHVEAMASWRHRTNSARICLSSQFFDKSHDLQLGHRTRSLEPFEEFHRLVMAEFGLTMIPNGPARDEVLLRRDSSTVAIGTCAMATQRLGS